MSDRRPRIVPSTTWLLRPAGVFLLLLTTADPSRGETAVPSDPLAERGWAVTDGAAPGYLPDRACATCHRDLADSYREVGMARAFFRPTAERLIENFDRPGFFHAPSKRHYEMIRRGDQVVFRRFQTTADGQTINLFETSVDWILGSGNRSRTYLYRTPSGELYQLPVAWYTQNRSWGMAPGFDRPDHEGVTRRVRRECMACHNAYPDVPAGSDLHAAPQVFPEELPKGIGCQRCHGPGAEHVRAALDDGDATPAALRLERIRETIVDPARLEPELQRDVCYQCHLQPSVAIPGVRRFGRGDYEFRPGRPLDAVRVGIDVVEEGVASDERFEINHHPYRLEQSRCFVASRGELSCLTCHDPHRKVEPDQRAAHYRQACLGCHQRDDAHSDPAGRAAGVIDPGDCVACHMPERRTQDVIHVTMTDHRITRRPESEAERLAPLQEKDPVLLDVVPLEPGRAPQGAEWELYRAVAVLRAGAQGAAADSLAGLLAAAPSRFLAEVGAEAGLDPWLDLARAQLELRRFEEAEGTLDRVLLELPRHSLALHWRGIARASRGERAAAIEAFQQSLALAPENPEPRFNLALLLLAEGKIETALEELDRVLTARPNLALGWLYRGQALERTESFVEAAEAYRRALEIDPALARAYDGLSRALLSRDERETALRYLRHGVEVARDRESLRQALQRLETPSSGQH